MVVKVDESPLVDRSDRSGRSIEATWRELHHTGLDHGPERSNGRALLRSKRVNDRFAITVASDVKRPRTTADVTVADELTFVARVDVDFDLLETVRTDDLYGVVHGAS